MKSHIKGSSLSGKSSVQEAIEHRDMLQVVQVIELCWAIALNEALHIGNKRLREVERCKQELMSKFDRYASSTGVSRAKGYTDIDTGIEWLLRVAESRKIDIETIGLRRTDNDR